MKTVNFFIASLKEIKVTDGLAWLEIAVMNISSPQGIVQGLDIRPCSIFEWYNFGGKRKIHS